MMRKTRSPAVIAWVILLLAPSFLFVYNLQAALLLYNEPVERATGQLLARIRSKAVPISYLPSSPKKTSSTRNRFVIMTVGTYAYRDYLTNLACLIVIVIAILNTRAQSPPTDTGRKASTR